MCPPGPLVVAGLTLTRRRWLTRQDANTIAASDMEHLDTFLVAHPPFDALAPERLRDLIAHAAVSEQDPGAVLLVEDGPPAPGMWVILTGSMDVVHSGEVIQVLEPGECFGHPSLLTGMAPAFTVRAREPSSCLLFAPEAARQILATDAGVSYVAGSLRKRLTRAGHTVHGLHDVGTTPVSAIMRPRRVRRGRGDHALGGAAAGGGSTSKRCWWRCPTRRSAILTDADVRAAVAGERLSPEAPAARARPGAGARPCRCASWRSRRPSTCSRPAWSTWRCSTGRASAGCSRRPICSAWTRAARSGCATRSSAPPTPDDPGAGRLAPAAAVPGAGRGPGCPRVTSGGCSASPTTPWWRGSSTSRSGPSGPAPLPWAWLDLGSAARREFTLASDQDNALAYARPAPGSELTPEARRRVLRAAGRRRQHWPGAVRDRDRQQRSAGRQPALAHVQARVAAHVRRVPDTSPTSPTSSGPRWPSTFAPPPVGWPSPPTSPPGSAPPASIRSSCA